VCEQFELQGFVFIAVCVSFKIENGWSKNAHLTNRQIFWGGFSRKIRAIRSRDLYFATIFEQNIDKKNSCQETKINEVKKSEKHWCESPDCYGRE